MGIEVGQATVLEFSNQNLFVRIEESVRDSDVFVVQPFSCPVSASILELLIFLDALKRASAARITAVIPYFAYGRTDKKDQTRAPITARLLPDCITVAGANRVLTMDLHAGQIQGFFNLPVDELTAQEVLAQYLSTKGLFDMTIVAADTGFAKRARNFAALLHSPLAIIESDVPTTRVRARACNSSAASQTATRSSWMMKSTQLTHGGTRARPQGRRRT